MRGMRTSGIAAASQVIAILVGCTFSYAVAGSQRAPGAAPAVAAAEVSPAGTIAAMAGAAGAAKLGMTPATTASSASGAGQDAVRGSAQAEAPEKKSVKRTILRRVAVPDSDYEVVVVLVEAPAGSSAGRHTHPGSVVGYVIDGEYTMLIEGRPAQSLAPGDSLEVPAGAVHDERAGNAPARLLAVFTVEKGKPLATPAP